MTRRPQVRYKIYSGSLQDRFNGKRTKIQMYAGGFGNGKTAAAIVLRVLPIARDYPGANILVARETFPKLNDTIRKEFLKWCPKHWIKSFPMSANASNTCTLINGSTINFRYIKQQGKQSEEGSTSNLLSATYDLIVVDQIEDPGIDYKDFTDLLGRLRGNTPYAPTGKNDPTMPRTGPRWMVLLCNPTRNWVYRRIVKPLHDYQESLEYVKQGKRKAPYISDDLICERDPDTDKPILDENGEAKLMLSIVEGSTYENKENLADDFIKTLESSYRGVMRARFLKGEWGAFEGLIYPDFNEAIHGIDREQMEAYLDKLRQIGYGVRWEAGYDYGIAVPSCFLLAFIDHFGNVCIIDGFHRKEYSISEQRFHIGEFADKYKIKLGPTSGHQQRLMPYADPSIFRRGPGGTKIVGQSVADMFNDAKEDGPRIMMRRGNAAIVNGITKVQAYLAIKPMHRNPFTQNFGAPHLYYASDLQFIADEATDYIWKPPSDNNVDDAQDMPRDGRDHAMDSWKYLLSNRPKPAIVPTQRLNETPVWARWHEPPDIEQHVRH